MIHIENPVLTIGELARHIESGSEPVRRSTHVGNQSARELAIMSLPPGVDVLAVDTIKGDDRYATPHTIRRSKEEIITLLSRSKASRHIVGSLVATDPYDDINKSLTAIHQGVLDELSLNNKPIAMMKFFRAYPEALGAMISACVETGQLRRYVHHDGTIRDSSHEDDTSIVYGKSAAVTSGALLPLNGMMALDMVVSTLKGSDTTMHLGGADMIRYTQDNERRQEVSKLFSHTLSALGMRAVRHRYKVVDVRGLAVSDHVSQHELKHRGDTIDLSEHYDKPTGITEI